MNSELGCNSLDASDSELVLPANLLEQLHLRSPLHPGLLPHQQDASAKKGGPIYSIEVGRFRVSKSCARRTSFILGRTASEKLRSGNDGALRHQLEARAAHREARSFRRSNRQNRHDNLTWIATPI